MKNSITCIVLLFSCRQSLRDDPFKIFNEGVALSLDAGRAAEKSDGQQATVLNERAIAKYRETLKIDPAHEMVRSALAHSLYLDKKYEEAIRLFKQQVKIDSTMAINYQEMGMCEISIGQVVQGKKDIYKAFEKDNSPELKEVTVDDLLDIGKLAYSYGEGYEKRNEPDKGKAYKLFALAVLNTVVEIDTTRKDVLATIDQLKITVKSVDLYRNMRVTTNLHQPLHNVQIK